ncbi:MAG: GNAT family N-acetyltransferase [Pseudomonadales bacterium]|nr:GNAT family N-acetyltransferase [Pseudomonadales bacterium]
MKMKNGCFSYIRRTMRHFVESAWGWDEILQRESFISSLPIKEFQILSHNNIPVGGYHTSDNSDHLLLNMILVEPDLQRQGLGNLMLDRIKQEARVGNKAIRLSVLKTNPAIDFHLKAGFEELESDEHSVKMLWSI